MVHPRLAFRANENMRFIAHATVEASHKFACGTEIPNQIKVADIERFVRIGGLNDFLSALSTYTRHDLILLIDSVTVFAPSADGGFHDDVILSWDIASWNPLKETHGRLHRIRMINLVREIVDPLMAGFDTIRNGIVSTMSLELP